MLQFESTLTTAQSFGALLKCARDLLHKDKGLKGGLDRMPLARSAAVPVRVRAFQRTLAGGGTPPQLAGGDACGT